MYIYDKNKDVLLHKKIDLSAELGGDDIFIDINEMSTGDFLAMKTETDGDWAKAISYIEMILPHLIRKHNFYKSEDELMTNEEVTELLFSSYRLGVKVASEYSNFLADIQKEKRD